MKGYTAFRDGKYIYQPINDLGITIYREASGYMVKADDLLEVLEQGKVVYSDSTGLWHENLKRHDGYSALLINIQPLKQEEPKPVTKAELEQLTERLAKWGVE
jgi:hypothetical protein